MNLKSIEGLSLNQINELYDEVIEIACGCECRARGMTAGGTELQPISDCNINMYACLPRCQARCTGHYCYCSGVGQPHCIIR